MYVYFFSEESIINVLETVMRAVNRYSHFTYVYIIMRMRDSSTFTYSDNVNIMVISCRLIIMLPLLSYCRIILDSLLYARITC